MIVNMRYPADNGELWAKSPEEGSIAGESLFEHSLFVADNYNVLLQRYPTAPVNRDLSLLGAIVHDLGKSLLSFQQMLRGGDRNNWRHEVASLGWLMYLLSHLDEAARKQIQIESLETFFRLDNQLDNLIWALVPVLLHHKTLDQLTDYTRQDTRAMYLDAIFSEGCLSDETLQSCWDFILFAIERYNIPYNFSNIDGPTVQDLKGCTEDSIQCVIRLQQSCRESETSQSWQIHRGLIRTSDHSASAHQEIHSFQPLRLNPLFSFPLREHQTQCSRKGSIMLVAPTGAGKTEAAFLWANAQQEQFRNVYYVLPYAAAINSMYLRMNEYIQGLLDESDVKGYDAEDLVSLNHAQSSQALFNIMIAEDEGLITSENVAQMIRRKEEMSRLFIPPIKVATPYSILRSFFHVRDADLVRASSNQSAVILDEIHAYDPEKFALICELIERLRDEGSVFMVMTATLHRAAKRHLITATGISDSNIIVLPKKESDRYTRHKLHIKKNDDLLSDVSIDHIVSLSSETVDISQDIYRLCQNLDAPGTKNPLPVNGGAISPHSCVSGIVESTRPLRQLVVLNTIKDAYQLYKSLQKKLPNSKIILAHSRFTQGDRQRLEAEIMSDNIDILVATQIVEVSLDISYDILHTQLAPIDGILQRAGRVNRKINPHTQTPYWPSADVFVYGNTERVNFNFYPYEQDYLEASFNALSKYVSQHGDLLVPHLMQEVVDNALPPKLEIEFEKQVTERRKIYKNNVMKDVNHFERNEGLSKTWESMFDSSVMAVCDIHLDQYMDLIQQSRFLEAASYTMSIPSEWLSYKNYKEHIIKFHDYFQLRGRQTTERFRYEKSHIIDTSSFFNYSHDEGLMLH